MRGACENNTGSLTRGGTIGYGSVGNTFNQCGYGVGAGGQNGLLNLPCNIHLNTGTVYYSNNWIVFDQLADQGKKGNNIKNPAGNRFDQNIQNGPLREIFSNASSNFIYYYCK